MTPRSLDPAQGHCGVGGKGALGPETQCTDPELCHSCRLTAVACSFYCFSTNNGVFPGKISSLKFPLRMRVTAMEGLKQKEMNCIFIKKFNHYVLVLFVSFEEVIKSTCQFVLLRRQERYDRRKTASVIKIKI